VSAGTRSYSEKAFQPRSRDIGLYLSCALRSTLGTQIPVGAVGWQVYDITRDPVALGSSAERLLPMLLLSSGRDLADRWDRRRI